MSPHREPVHEEMVEGRWQKDKEESKVRHKPYSCLCACPSPTEQQEGEGKLICTGLLLALPATTTKGLRL